MCDEFFLLCPIDIPLGVKIYKNLKKPASLELFRYAACKGAKERRAYCTFSTNVCRFHFFQFCFPANPLICALVYLRLTVRKVMKREKRQIFRIVFVGSYRCLEQELNVTFFIFVSNSSELFIFRLGI